MSLKDKINSENPLISLENLNFYHSKMSALQQANTSKIAQIVGELAGATAQLTKTTAKVDCDHRYEITGATNDEHNLAVEDQQMLINKISGRTLVRNQFVNINNVENQTKNGVTMTNNGDGTFTFSGNHTITGQSWFVVLHSMLINLTHKYFLIGCPKGGSSISYALYSSQNDVAYNGDFGDGTIFENMSSTVPTQISILIQGVGEKNLTFKPQLIDLTQAYGAGNEPTTVEEVLNDFPDYIEYNEGTFVHSNNRLISTSRNLWNEKWEVGAFINGLPTTASNTIRSADFIQVIPNTKIYCNLYNTYITSYTVDKTYINRTSIENSFIVPKNCYYIKFNTSSSYGEVYNNDICINVYDESFNGTYEPYKEEVIEGIGELKQYQYKDNNSDQTINSSILYTVSEEEGYGYNDATIKNSFYIAGISASFKNIGYNFAGKYLFNNNKITKFYVGTHPNYPGRLDAVIETAKYYDTAEEFMADIKGSIILGESTEFTITKSNLPAGYSAYKGGMQIQEGTIPYLIEKQYALSIASQVVQNIEIDREQQKYIDNMKVDIDHKQPLLLSGQNIKTFNGQSMLGSGDLAWNDPMFLAKFNRVTPVDNIIDEFLESKQYRIYSDSDAGLNFDIQVRITLTDLATGGAFDYVNLNLSSSKNYIDFQYMGYSLSSNSRTIYINYILNGVETTKTFTYNGSDYVIADVINNGSISIVGTYAAVFEPVELLTKEDLVEIKPIQSIKEVFVIDERGGINFSKMPILVKPIYMYNKTKGNSYYLFYDLSSASPKCMKNGHLKELSEIFYSLSLYPDDDNKVIEFEQSEYDDGDIIEIIYEYGYIDPTIFIET